MTRPSAPQALSLLLCIGLAFPAAAQDATAPAAPAPEAPTAETTPPATTAPEAATPGAATPEATPPQTAPDAAPVDGLSMGATEGAGSPADGPGSLYVASQHGDWALRCVRTEDGSDPCQLYQLLEEAAGNAVAEISIFPLPDGQPAVAGATIVVPLETLLPEQLRLEVDGGAAKLYPFTWCAQEGCIARVGLAAAEIESFRRGASASVTVVPVVAPDQKVVAQISLAGFTAGYDALVASETAPADAPPADAAPAEPPAN